jgi:2-keto-4-pentenoate hydratase/2-oxohepta-3-ene-1,7-dioic acid hydratase in catechol pathway
MKLAYYEAAGLRQIGVVQGERVIPLSALLPDAPTDMIALIRDWDRLRHTIEPLKTDAGLPLSKVTLLAPVQRPGKVLAIGLNYADHIAETGNKPHEQQLWFSKASTSIHAPFAPVEVPIVSTQVDYEVELVAIIGKPGRHISREDAPDHVFGYCVGNDVSVRDWQRQTPQWMLGKSFDTHGPIGPWITTADELGEPHRLDIKCIVNGEVRQSSNTKHLVFDVWAQIEHLSKVMTLEPGDIIFTGTPGGVGLARKPPVFLAAGDKVVCEIAELGVIEAVMVQEA